MSKIKDMKNLLGFLKKFFNFGRKEKSVSNTYFLLRHGQTLYQLKEDMHYPWPERKDAPVLLTEKGKKRIEQVAEELKSKNIDLIFSSDLNRARQTAGIIKEQLGLGVAFDDRLRDINYGVFHGKTRKEFYKDFPDTKERFKTAPLKGESWSDCRKRVKAFLLDVEEKYQGKRILVIGHGDPLWLLEGLIKGKTDKELLKEKLEGKIIKVGEFRFISVNLRTNQR